MAKHEARREQARYWKQGAAWPGLEWHRQGEEDRPVTGHLMLSTFRHTLSETRVITSQFK